MGREHEVLECGKQGGIVRGRMPSCNERRGSKGPRPRDVSRARAGDNRISGVTD